MRITGGKYKGKTIQTIKGQEVRPTSSKVRESIFNIIQLSEAGTVFYDGETIMLDLFAGSGIIGLEALSRGAKNVVFVEKNFRHAEIIKKNIQHFLNSNRHGEKDNIKLVVSDALNALERLEGKFNFIFIDPPYASGIYKQVLNKIQENSILSTEGIIILEHSSGLNVQEIISETKFQIYKTKIYGDTGITVLIHYKNSD